MGVVASSTALAVKIAKYEAIASDESRPETEKEKVKMKEGTVRLSTIKVKEIGKTHVMMGKFVIPKTDFHKFEFYIINERDVSTILLKSWAVGEDRRIRGTYAVEGDEREQHALKIMERVSTQLAEILEKDKKKKKEKKTSTTHTLK